MTPCLTLSRHDTTPSFLKHAIENKSTTERSPKRTKLTDRSDNTISISSRLLSDAYRSLQDLCKDAQHVSEELVAGIRAKIKEREGQNGERLSVDDLKQIQRVQAYEQVIKDVVEQEGRYEAAHGSKTVKQEADRLRNGHVPAVDKSSSGRSGTVLTLFGNAPTPKQLFSSMQRPSSEQSDSIIKIELPVEEMSLPNGLTATKIMPVPSDEKKKGPTFDDSFAPAYNLPALNPPKAHKRSTTRDTTITWEFKDPVSRNKKGGYTVQSLTVGSWLSYGGTDSKDEPSSPREKRKLRDRVLSSGESSLAPLNKASLEEALLKEEEALFKRAYSTFAPSHDNSKALIPEETKSMVWWHKAGHQRYNETFAIDPALLDERPVSLPDVLPEVEEMRLKDEDFGKAVEEYEGLDEDDFDVKPVTDKTAVDQVLKEISTLLETLASHQRIRNASLASSTAVTRTPISPAPTLASRIGRPDSPAEDEMSTYYALRREVAYLILKLPPYAVAKLDGDQLSELGVSRLLTFEDKDTKGTMEEDQVARLAKYTAMATAAGLATLTRPGSSTGQHYSSTAQRTPAIGQAANTRYGQSAQYGASRTPVQPQFQRSVSNQSTYGTPSATAPRPGYGQPNQYSRPGAPQPGYGQANGQSYYRPPQQTTGGYGGYSQQYGQSTPQQRPAYASSQPLAQYQQRSQAAAQNAVAYQTNTGQQQPSLTPFNRNASPIKPSGYPQPVAPSPRPQQYPLQPPSRTATPSSYPSQPQTPVNGFQQPRPVVPRAQSGTPQPPPIQPAPSPQPPAPQQQAQTNGHT